MDVMKMALQRGDLLVFLGEMAERDAGYAALVQKALSVLRMDLGLRFASVKVDSTADALSRLDADCLALRPAAVSILLGASDVADGLPAAETEENLSRILARIREVLGDIPVLLIEPFLLPGHTVPVERANFDTLLAAERRLAEKHGALFVPMDAPLCRAADAFPPHSLSEDGIHLTPEGHGVLAKHLLDAVLPIL